MINSQQLVGDELSVVSISKGMGDQFSAWLRAIGRRSQYIKGDG